MYLKAKYLKIIYSEQEISAAGLEDQVPTRVSNKGQKPTLAYLESDVVKVKRK